MISIAAFRHRRHLAKRPFRRHANAEETDTQRTSDFAHLRKVRHQLAGGLMHGLDRRARELELTSRLERDGAAAGHVVEADDVFGLHDRFPSEQMPHSVEESLDAARAVIRDRGVALERECEFLMLGADAKISRGLDPASNQATSSCAIRWESCRFDREPCRDPAGMGRDHTRGSLARAMCQRSAGSAPQSSRTRDDNDPFGGTAARTS